MFDDLKPFAWVVADDGSPPTPAPPAAGTSGECRKCPADGFLCDDGTTLSSLEVRPGFWRASVTSMVAEECPIAEACVGGAFADSPDALCVNTSSIQHTGPLCAVCPAGYARQEDVLCRRCPPTSELGELIMYAAGLFLALILLVYLGYQCGRAHQHHLNHLGHNGPDCALDESLGGARKTIRRSSTSLHDLIGAHDARHTTLNRRTGGLLTKIKILVGLYQLVTQFGSIFGIQWPVRINEPLAGGLSIPRDSSFQSSPSLPTRMRTLLPHTGCRA